jgi:hypothetical protein
MPLAFHQASEARSGFLIIDKLQVAYILFCFTEKMHLHIVYWLFVLTASKI